MENHPSDIVKILRLAALEGICVLILFISNNFYITIVLLPVIIVLSLILFFRIRNNIKDSITEE
jgi:glycerol-3-phosphate acyltransferase PlsY